MLDFLQSLNQNSQLASQLRQQQAQNVFNPLGALGEGLGSILGGKPMTISAPPMLTTRPQTFASGQVIRTSDINALTNQLLSQFNGNLDNADILPTHLSQVRYFRENFKEYSKEEFKNMSKEPVIKDILAGAYKLGAKETKDRIQQHLDNLNK